MTSDYYPYTLVYVYQGQGTDRNYKEKKMDEDRVATLSNEVYFTQKKKWIAAYHQENRD